ncbi:MULTISPECIES: homoserine dehydrogenase [unclassified Ruminococcus]|uniref:homoserine dehydrogenase n=1 Tax=unclassified Ruminococcus TaxID=2608920 RepID=UPI00210CD01C|nr:MULTISPECIES: homoserine dehydrogenase [unclassified Ruminococcus]MCQ4022009.1 homoserine dehydrogenase [Ruminococcus sp. zg-924]MCQ4114545.1 homoserine dehydrogenase [Ruminococcus sp. zg-921]
MINIAIMGYGTVGSGVAEIIVTHKESLAKRAKEEINIKYILDIREFPGDPLEEKFTKDFNDIINDDEVKVVVEVMGGLRPAYDFVKQCLEKGKSVVTSNKELVAAKGAELLQIAQDNNVNFLFEASVGGGIPIIRPMSQCLAANEVVEVAGILNGTTNFILTKMIREQMSFEDALSLAQRLGYAEKDPTADVEGLDAVRKICILASLAYGKHVYPDNIHTEGISKITLADVAYASAWGGVIKLIGSVKKLDDGRIDIFVAPMILESSSQLAGVDDVFNGIMVRGDSTGDVVFYGKGAGKMPTASAVVADVIDCIKHLKARKYLYWADSENEYVLPYDESVCSMYLRVSYAAGTDIKSTAKAALGEVSFITSQGSAENEAAFITKPMTVKKFNELADKLVKNGIVIESRIRMGDDL